MEESTQAAEEVNERRPPKTVTLEDALQHIKFLREQIGFRDELIAFTNQELQELEEENRELREEAEQWSDVDDQEEEEGSETLKMTSFAIINLQTEFIAAISEEKDVLKANVKKEVSRRKEANTQRGELEKKLSDFKKQGSFYQVQLRDAQEGEKNALAKMAEAREQADRLEAKCDALHIDQLQKDIDQLRSEFGAHQKELMAARKENKALLSDRAILFAHQVSTALAARIGALTGGDPEKPLHLDQYFEVCLQDGWEPVNEIFKEFPLLSHAAHLLPDLRRERTEIAHPPRIPPLYKLDMYADVLDYSKEDKDAFLAAVECLQALNIRCKRSVDDATNKKHSV
jgi:hypothetical protein